MATYKTTIDKEAIGEAAGQGALSGALEGAGAGATIGMVGGPIFALIGGGIGALVGGAGGGSLAAWGAVTEEKAAAEAGKAAKLAAEKATVDQAAMARASDTLYKKPLTAAAFMPTGV